MGYAFISYSSQQQKDADSLRLLLHANHIQTWMAPYDLPTGTDYADVVNNAIQNASCFVLLLTEDAQKSIYVDKEIERALHYGKTIAPIQLDSAVLNDSFSFYLCNQQIIMVPTIDAAIPKMQTLLQHLRLLCNDQLPQKEESIDASRDKRVRRQKIARFFRWSGFILLCISLFCGRQYVTMVSRVSNLMLYLYTSRIPTLPTIALSYGLFFALAVLGALVFLYGYGLRDPQRKSWNFFRVLPRHLLLPVFSVLCGNGFALLFQARQSIEQITYSLELQFEPTAGYYLPRWVTPTLWVLGIVFIVTVLLSFTLIFIRDKKNDFAACKAFCSKVLTVLQRQKRGGK